MPFLITKCEFCEYVTNVKCNLVRHHNAKHPTKILNKIINEDKKENVSPCEENVSLCEEIVSPCRENVSPCRENACYKCRKVYKTKKYLLNHQIKCKGIDELTCSKCMISFTTRAAKSRHIKTNKCKARSIIHARIPNVQNISGPVTIQNAETIQNINNTNNIIINNIGSERIDHITEDELNKILQCGINTVPLYIEKKHFDSNFPENKNIKYTYDNKCKVMEDNMWKEKDIGILSTDLIKDNTEVLLMYCDNNEIKLLNQIKDTDKYDHIRNKLFIIYNKSDNQKYNHMLSKIKDLIKNSNIEESDE
jgi:hypothetical protein